MNIGMTSFGADGGKSGISQYVIQLLKQFAEQPGDNQFQLYVYKNERDLYPTSEKVRAIPFGEKLRAPMRNIAWHQWGLSKWCKRQAHDVLFLPAGNRRLPGAAPCPTVGTVHDFSSLHVAGKYDWARTAYIRQVLPCLIRRLTRVLTISESSKRDIVEYVGISPDRVTVAPLAVDHAVFYPRDRGEQREKLEQLLGVRGPFILYISRLEHPGKNHVRLIEAFNQVKAQLDVPHRLLLVGSDWSGSEAVHEAAAASRYSDDILLPGFVESQHLPTLYSGADLHVFPSLYEGFGLPVLEALASGLPTACSNTSSLPEVAGEAVEYFDPLDVDAITDVLSQLLIHSEQRERLVSRGIAQAGKFSWRRTAAQTLQVLEEAAAC